MANLIEIRNLTKRFGAVAAVDDVTLDIGEGEFFALLGPSGCGKTTLMRCIAGLEEPDTGGIRIGGRDMQGAPPYERPVNMMFQSYALFPHMSVERNIAFGLEQARMPRAAIQARVAELLHLVQLEGLNGRRPDQLSGGQRQRVALARALARKPQLLLLDEPLAALDRKLREETQFELKRVQRELGASFMLVTHDQDEAMAMASRIAIMRGGAIEQIGSPREVYNAPMTRFVAGFVGEINLFEGKVFGVEERALGRVVKALCAEGEIAGISDRLVATGDRVAIAVRPEAIEIAPAGEACANALAGEIDDIVFRGDAVLARVKLASGFLLRASIAPSGASAAQFSRNSRVIARFKPQSARVLTT